MTPPFSHRLRVRYSECDMQGAVFNANYLTYFDTAITELWRDAVGRWHELTARGIDMVVAEANVRYRRPARFDDVVDVAVEVLRLGTTAITTRLSLLREGEELATGELRHVLIDAGTGAKTEMPDDIRRALEPYLATPQPAR